MYIAMHHHPHNHHHHVYCSESGLECRNLPEAERSWRGAQTFLSSFVCKHQDLDEEEELVKLRVGSLRNFFVFWLKARK